MATKNYSEADMGDMSHYDPNLGRKINQRAGTKRVPRGTQSKSVKKPAPKQLLQRGGTTTKNAAQRKSPSTASTGMIPKAAQGNANSTKTGISNDAMMSAAKKLLAKK